MLHSSSLSAVTTPRRGGQVAAPRRFESPTRSSTIKSVLATVKQKTIQRVQTLEQRAKDVSRAAVVCRGRRGYAAFCSSTYGASVPIRDVLDPNRRGRGVPSPFGPESAAEGGALERLGITVDQVALLCSDQRDPRLVAPPLRVAFTQSGALLRRSAQRASSMPPRTGSSSDRSASLDNASFAYRAGAASGTVATKARALTNGREALLDGPRDVSEAVRIALISRSLARRSGSLQPGQLVIVDQSPHRPLPGSLNDGEVSSARRSRAHSVDAGSGGVSPAEKQLLAQRIGQLMEVNRRLAESATVTRLLPPPSNAVAATTVAMDSLAEPSDSDDETNDSDGSAEGLHDDEGHISAQRRQDTINPDEALHQNTTPPPPVHTNAVATSPEVSQPPPLLPTAHTSSSSLAESPLERMKHLLRQRGASASPPPVVAAAVPATTDAPPPQPTAHEVTMDQAAQKPSLTAVAASPAARLAALRAEREQRQQSGTIDPRVPLPNSMPVAVSAVPPAPAVEDPPAPLIQAMTPLQRLQLMRSSGHHPHNTADATPIRKSDASEVNHAAAPLPASTPSHQAATTSSSTAMMTPTERLAAIRAARLAASNSSTSPTPAPGVVNVGVTPSHHHHYNDTTQAASSADAAPATGASDRSGDHVATGDGIKSLNAVLARARAAKAAQGVATTTVASV